MESWRPRSRTSYPDIADGLRQHAMLALLMLLTAIPLPLIASFAPAPLILPVASLVFLALSGLIALLALRKRAVRRSTPITGWDLAGALAFVGFAAAILSKPENVLTAFAGAIAG